MQGSGAAQQTLNKNHNMFDAQHVELGWSRVCGCPSTAPKQGSWGWLLCPEGPRITQPWAAKGLLGLEHDPAIQRQVQLLDESLVLHPKQQQDSNPT